MFGFWPSQRLGQPPNPIFSLTVPSPLSRVCSHSSQRNENKTFENIALSHSPFSASISVLDSISCPSLRICWTEEELISFFASGLWVQWINIHHSSPLIPCSICQYHPGKKTRRKQMVRVAEGVFQKRRVAQRDDVRKEEKAVEEGKDRRERERVARRAVLEKRPTHTHSHAEHSPSAMRKIARIWPSHVSFAVLVVERSIRRNCARFCCIFCPTHILHSHCLTLFTILFSFFKSHHFAASALLWSLKPANPIFWLLLHSTSNTRSRMPLDVSEQRPRVGIVDVVIEKTLPVKVSISLLRKP